MTSALRRVAACAATAVAASALLVPLAAVPASAATPTETEFFLSYDANYNSGLWKRTTPNGTATLVAGGANLDLYDLSVSRDGSRVVYKQDSYDNEGNPLREQVVVRDVSTRVVRVVADVAGSGSVYDLSPTLSPDGNTVVWERVTKTSSSFSTSLMKAAVGSGGATTVATGYYPGEVFLDGSTVLARSLSSGHWATVPVAGGSAQSTTVPDAANEIAVSADGHQLAWSLDTTPADVSTSDLQVASLSLTNGAATVGTPTTIATGQDNRTPSFSRDGNTVYFVKWDGDMGNGDIWSASTTPGTPTVTVSTPNDDDIDVVIGSTDDGTPPADPTSLPATLSGTAATVRWTEPVDPDLSGVIVTRKLGTTLQKTVFVPAPATSYVDSGLVPGSTYTYTFTSVDRSGTVGVSPATRLLTAIAPGATFADPISTTSTTASFPVRFATTAPSNVHFTVDYLQAGTTTYQHWVVGAAGVTRTFGAPATTGVLATTAVPGATYSFHVTASDAYGNSTATVLSGKAVVPFDQTKATMSGGLNIASSAAYLGMIRLLKTTTDYARVSLVGNRLQVVGWKCAKCGKFAIYDNNVKIATVDTYASSTKVRQVLFAKTYSTSATHSFVIRPLATAGRPAVELDGFAMRR